VRAPVCKGLKDLATAKVELMNAQFDNVDDEERIATLDLAHLLGIPHDDILAELEEQRREWELEEEERLSP